MLALRSSEKCVLHCSYIELYSKYLVVLTRIVKMSFCLTTDCTFIYSVINSEDSQTLFTGIFDFFKS